MSTSNHLCNRPGSRYTCEQQQQHQLQQQEQRSFSPSSKRSYAEHASASNAHEYAKQLNNVSAMRIEMGEYSKAIESLAKALKFSKNHTTDQLLDRSEFDHCSLDGCIHHSENYFNLIKKNNCRNDNKDSIVDIIDDEQPTLYRKPVLIPNRSICKSGHNMGSTLFVIITFNLALAHHLKALEKKSCSESSSLIKNAVGFYKLSNNWQNPQQQYYARDNIKDEDDPISITEEDHEDVTNSTYSIRFNTILYNNLNHLNQLIMGNDDDDDDDDDGRSIKSSKQCLVELISAVTPVIIIDTNNYGEQKCHQLQECDDDYDDDDLEFEDEFCNRQEKIHHRYSSSTALKRNQQWDDRVVSNCFVYYLSLVCKNIYAYAALSNNNFVK